MAYRNNAAQSTTSRDDKEPATGFLNFEIPADTPTGWRKLGNGIPLTASVVSEKELVESIRENPEAACAYLMSIGRFVYRDNVPAVKSSFKLDGMKAAIAAAKAKPPVEA